MNLARASAVEVTLRGDRPALVLVGLDAGSAFKPPQVVPIAVTADYRRHTIAFSEFGSGDLHRVRALRLSVVERVCSGFQVAEVRLVGDPSSA